MPIEQRAAILPVEAALEVGFEPTSHHDSEYLTAPYLDHSEPAQYDSEWSNDDSDSGIEDHRSTYIQRTHGFNNGRSKLLYSLTAI